MIQQLKNQKNDYDNYLESIVSNFLSNTISKAKSKLVQMFSKGDAELIYDDAINSIKEKFPNDYNVILNKLQAVSEIVLSKNKDDIASLFQTMFAESDEVIVDEPKFSEIKKEVFQRVSKGFVPSAMFYPVLKMFEEIMKILNGDKELQNISFNLNSVEIASIVGAFIMFTAFKLVKETYKAKKEYVKLKTKELEHEKIRKQQIKERINKEFDKKLWKKEEMDEWISQKLWSPDELEKLIDERIKKLSYKEEEMSEYYKQYLESAQENSLFNKVNKFKEIVKSFKNITIKKAKEMLYRILNKLSDDDLQKLIELPSQNIVNEDIYDESFKDILKNAGKNISGAVFGPLSFLPAFNVWVIIDKAVSEGSFDVLNNADKNRLAIYASLYAGLIGGQALKNIIRDYLKERKNKKKEENYEI